MLRTPLHLLCCTQQFRTEPLRSQTGTYNQPYKPGTARRLRSPRQLALLFQSPQRSRLGIASKTWSQCLRPLCRLHRRSKMLRQLRSKIQHRRFRVGCPTCLGSGTRVLRGTRCTQRPKHNCTCRLRNRSGWKHQTRTTTPPGRQRSSRHPRRTCQLGKGCKSLTLLDCSVQARKE